MVGILVAVLCDEAGAAFDDLERRDDVTRGVRLGALVTSILEQVANELEPSPPTQGPEPTPCPQDLIGVLGRWWCGPGASWATDVRSSVAS